MMRASTLFIVAMLSVTLSFTHCKRGRRDREAQVAPILEEVFRCEIRQFVEGDPMDSGVIACLGIRQGTDLIDPDEMMIGRLNGKRGIRPLSECEVKSAVRLIVGPVEWLADDEVRVRGSYVRDAGTIPLLYRVVRDADRWRCLGQIVINDPL